MIFRLSLGLLSQKISLETFRFTRRTEGVYHFLPGQTSPWVNIVAKIVDSHIYTTFIPGT